MSNAKVNPPITHIPTKLCSVCGIPALGGYDLCLTHLQESENPYREDESWEYGDKELDNLMESVCGKVD